jgi:hypothetical protein
MPAAAPFRFTANHNTGPCHPGTTPIRRVVHEKRPAGISDCGALFLSNYQREKHFEKVNVLVNRTIELNSIKYNIPNIATRIEVLPLEAIYIQF